MKKSQEMQVQVVEVEKIKKEAEDAVRSEMQAQVEEYKKDKLEEINSL